MLPLLRIQVRKVSTNYLTASITLLKPVEAPSRKRSQTVKPQNTVITPKTLAAHFKDADDPEITTAQLTQTQNFFNKSKFQLDWTIGKYADIPDIKYARLQKEKLDQYAGKEPYRKTEYDETFLSSKKTFGITPNLLKPLPEVLLLGHTNVGKSSLVNNLLLDRAQNKSSSATTEYAYVSKRAGYTKTLNCYNVGQKLRIVDSPGYGEYGDLSQGDLVIEYINNRNLLRGAFILIDSIDGVRDEDLVIMSHLAQAGIAFDIVFTKVDAVIKKKYDKPDAILLHYKNLIEDCQLQQIGALPKLFFNNATTNKYLTMRNGYKEIRLAVLQACGLL